MTPIERVLALFLLRLAVGSVFSACETGKGDEVSLLHLQAQAPDVLQDVHEKNAGLRKLLEVVHVPGVRMDTIPDRIPEINLTEVHGLVPLVPGLVKAASNEFPGVVAAAQALASAAKEGGAKLVNATAADRNVTTLRANLKDCVASFKTAWVAFARSFAAGVEKTIDPIIKKAQDRSTFVPQSATDMLMIVVNDQLLTSSLSTLAQLPVNAPGTEGLVRLNRIAEHADAEVRGLLARIGDSDPLAGKALNETTLHLEGQNSSEVYNLSQNASACLKALRTASAELASSIHRATEEAGVAWQATVPRAAAEEKEETQSLAARTTYGVMPVALLFAVSGGL